MKCSCREKFKHETVTCGVTAWGDVVQMKRKTRWKMDFSDSKLNTEELSEVPVLVDTSSYVSVVPCVMSLRG